MSQLSAAYDQKRAITAARVAAHMARAKQLYAQGQTASAIADVLGRDERTIAGWVGAPSKSLPVVGETWRSIEHKERVAVVTEVSKKQRGNHRARTVHLRWESGQVAAMTISAVRAEMEKVAP